MTQLYDWTENKAVPGRPGPPFVHLRDLLFSLIFSLNGMIPTDFTLHEMTQNVCKNVRIDTILLYLTRTDTKGKEFESLLLRQRPKRLF